MNEIQFIIAVTLLLYIKLFDGFKFTVQNTINDTRKVLVTGSVWPLKHNILNKMTYA